MFNVSAAFCYTRFLRKICFEVYLDLVFCYKIVFGLVSVNLDDFFRFNLFCGRGDPYKLFNSRCTSDINVKKTVVL